ncbi:MAG: glycosyltransferase family 2 protein, partial [Nitrosopumilus sp.]|nr:glycosyltransferase family 2 protein [Nitrosopumilus sp.]
MTFPLVSIIIPTYNGAKRISTCLESVFMQDYANFEIIAVNNNSIDTTLEVLEAYQKKDSRLLIVFEKEISRGAARNTGEKYAHGKIIVMIDDDCIAPDHHWLQKLITPLLTNQADIVQGFEQPLHKNFWSDQYYIRVLHKFEKIQKTQEITGTIDTKNFAINKS